MLAFFKALFDANDSRVSFGRFMSMWALAFVLAWDSVQVWFGVHYNLTHPNVAPIPILPAPTELLGQATFVVTFYGLSKVVSAFTAKADPGAKLNGSPQNP